MDNATSIPFDQYQRYGVAAKAITALRKNGESLRILEVGANTHKLLGRLLPNDQIVYLDLEIPLDMQGQDDFIVGDATELTLLDASFDVVVALDVFEHIPNVRRDAFIYHTSRVARLLTIIGAPFDFTYVVEAEREVLCFWSSLFDTPYRWLAEHAENGLPNLDLTRKSMVSMGYHLHTLQHGNLELWKAFIKGHFSEVCVGSLQPLLSILYQHYQNNLFESDFSTEESYRSFVFCSREAITIDGIKGIFSSPKTALANEISTNLLIQILDILPSIALEKSKLDGAVRDKDVHIGNLTQVLQAKDIQISSITQEVHDKDVHIGTLTQAVHDKDVRIETVTQALHNKDVHIATLTQAVHDKEVHIGNLNNAMQQRDVLISALQGSTSWRITRPLRFVMYQFKRIRCAVALVKPALIRGGGIKNTFLKASSLYQREGFSGIKRGFRFAANGGQIKPAIQSDGFDRNDYAEWIRRYDALTDEIRDAMRIKVESFASKPLISVVMPTYNPKPEWLIEAIESVRRQIYSNWELCIADDASTDTAIRPILERYASTDARIKVVFRENNGHISNASNSALAVATGDWVALLDHDDLLADHALFFVAEAINQHLDLRLIYSDEDKVAENGERVDAYFKCDWNEDLFFSHNLITHLGVYRRDILNTIGGFRGGFEGAQDYDLALRHIEHIEPQQIFHIPRILYHWRVHAASTAQSSDAKPYALLAGEKALNEHFQRVGVKAHTNIVPHGYRVKYDLPEVLPLVSLVIPTRNGLSLLKQCIDSILNKTSYPNYEILIVDNGSDDEATLQYLKALRSEDRVRVIRDEQPFNYSALNNAAVRLARGEIIGLVNNDIEVISPDWLGEMVSHALRPNIGAVGAKLYYSNGTLQHAGVILGIGGVAGHAHKHISQDSGGYFSRANLIQGLSAVTAACLVIRKVIYEAVGGLNEADLRVAFNDIDFCLRVREAGYRNIWTPYAELYHHESATRGFEDTPEKQARFSQEVQYMWKRWGAQLDNDPAYNPNLTLDHEDFSLAWPPRESSVNAAEEKKVASR